MDAEKDYVKYFYILSNIVLTAFVLILANFFISPFIAAFIIAILLNPLYSSLVKFGIPKILSASFSVLVFFLTILLLFSFITAQLSYITADPTLSAAPIIEAANACQKWIARFFDFSIVEQAKIIEASFKNFMNNAAPYISNVLVGTTSYLSILLLFFINLFFLLYYNNFIMSFICKISGKDNVEKVKDNAVKIEEAVKNYIVGLFIVIAVVATLNSVGLLLLGVKHAIFFGILGGVLTIIPFLGILIGSLLPAVFVFLVTGSVWQAITVILLFSVVQFLEGNIITPNIVGSKANINPYVAILGLFVGGALLGGIGIVLAIPILGIIKIICDDSEHLKPIGYILGNPRKESNTLMKFLCSLFTRNKKSK